MSLNRGICMSCGCILSLTSPHGSPISCVLPSTGRLGPSRAEVGVGFRCVRLVQALPSSPPLRWSCSVSVGLRFSFPLPFRVCPLWARCVVLVFSLSLFFCVPSSRPGYFLCRGSTRKFFAPWTSCGSSTTRPQLIASSEATAGRVTSTP